MSIRWTHRRWRSSAWRPSSITCPRVTREKIAIEVDENVKVIAIDIPHRTVMDHHLRGMTEDHMVLRSTVAPAAGRIAIGIANMRTETAIPIVEVPGKPMTRERKRMIITVHTKNQQNGDDRRTETPMMELKMVNVIKLRDRAWFDQENLLRSPRRIHKIQTDVAVELRIVNLS